MNIRRDKRGMALPFVLGIVTFVIGVIATLISYAIFQSRLIAKNLESTETYINAVQSIDATIHIITRDQSLDPTYLTNLATYMGVTITPFNDTVWMISSPSSTTTNVVSYISGDPSSLSVYDDQFAFTGLETNFEQKTAINALSLVSAYVPQFLSTTFPSLTPQTEFASFNALFTYIDSLSQFTNVTANYINSLPNRTVNNHYFVTDNLSIPTNGNLIIPPEYLLFISGNLVIGRDAILTGNVIVSGTVTISGNANSIQSIRGTVYAGTSITLSRKISLGTSTRPAFLITPGTITFPPTLVSISYGYFLAGSNSVKSGDYVDLRGGVYPTDPNLSTTEVQPYTLLDPTDFYSYALPIFISNPQSTELSNFRFTSPK